MNQRPTPISLYIASFAHLALLSETSPVFAQDLPAPPPPLSTQQCADQWLESNQLGLGANPHPDGSFDFVASSEEQVPVQMNSANWVIARQDAFEKARLNAMREMVAYFKEGVHSDNVVTTTIEGEVGGQKPIPSDPSSASSGTSATDGNLKKVVTQSEAQTQSAPSEQADPNAGSSILHSALKQQINAASEDVLVGVAVAKQCEGLSEADGTATGGKYSVSVTLLWSTALQKLAQSMFTVSDIPIPDRSAEPLLENRPTLKERFAAASKAAPDWMAYELGARVYTDADGENVVVSFGAVPATAFKSADVSRADLIARQYIAEFQRTHVSGVRDANSQTSYNVGGEAGSGRFSDGSVFSDRIEVKTPTKQLTGIYPLATWRGKHPESERGMVVVARAWKRSAQTQAQKTSPIRGSGTNGSPDTAPAGKITSPALTGMSMSKGDY